MHPIEQAREALKDVLSSLVAAHSLLSRSPKTAAPSDKMFDTMMSDYAKSIKRGREAIASLSNPVDGVGAEPGVKPFYVIDIPINAEGNGPCSVKEATHISYEVWHQDTLTHGRHRRLSDAIQQEDELNQRAALASPEAEARLRERVVDAIKAERERIAKALEVEADALPCAEDAAVMRSNAQLVRADFSYEEAERLDIAAEARLAQAEGGPAVTDEMVERAAIAAWEEDNCELIAPMECDGFHNLSDRKRVHLLTVFRAALEAALHPQSAAGEEGKP